MIECVFTLDYEIYGNGEGALAPLVYEPAEKLAELFRYHGLRFVNFVEVAELEQIERRGSDPEIDRVVRQVRKLAADGFETALHLHPQWYNADFKDGRWRLDMREYNLCTLANDRIAAIVKRAVDYLVYLVDDSSFVPLSFRAGNWLFQPTQPAAGLLAAHGIRIDSSVFKGGRQHANGLDYRRAVSNGLYWSFSDDVNVVDPSGPLLEVPIHTELVASWRMATSKRLAFKGSAPYRGGGAAGGWHRLRDLARWRYPLKLDFCRMTLNELTAMLAKVLREDRADPETLRPIVAIGHTKDLMDLDTVDNFLRFLVANAVRVSTFADMYRRLRT